MPLHPPPRHEPRHPQLARAPAFGAAAAAGGRLPTPTPRCPRRPACLQCRHRRHRFAVCVAAGAADTSAAAGRRRCYPALAGAPAVSADAIAMGSTAGGRRAALPAIAGGNAGCPACGGAARHAEQQQQAAHEQQARQTTHASLCMLSGQSFCRAHTSCQPWTRDSHERFVRAIVLAEVALARSPHQRVSALPRPARPSRVCRRHRAGGSSVSAGTPRARPRRAYGGDGLGSAVAASRGVVRFSLL